MQKTGGINRKNYWAMGFFLLGGVLLVARFHYRHPGLYPYPFFIATLLMAAIMAIALVIQRLHSIGLPGWWALVFILFTAASPWLGILFFVLLGALTRDHIDELTGRGRSPVSPPAILRPDEPSLQRVQTYDNVNRPSVGKSGMNIPIDSRKVAVSVEGKRLAAGSVMFGYQIVRLLGEGGFGLTYLAQDMQVGRAVVIKEFFPEELVRRSGDGSVLPLPGDEKDFYHALETFRDEAKIMARFDHPAIVKILSFFEANKTAYIVMEYLRGEDLDQVLRQRGHFSDEASILEIIMPILEGLKEVHRYHYLHRDIKPSNILLCSGRLPTLIDFGASRQLIGKKSGRVTTILTAGYAPIEQYGGSMERQGPYTDLYAVGAVMYKMITSEAPPDAQVRSYQVFQNGSDPYRPLEPRYADRFRPRFLRAVDKALSLKAADRPQSVEEFQRELVG